MELKDVGYEGGVVVVGVNLFELKLSMFCYLKDFFFKKRIVVIYFFVFMIVDEYRNRKLYVIFVCFFLYRLFIDVKLRELEVQLEEVMRIIGMIVVGMCQCKYFVNLRY